MLMEICVSWQELKFDSGGCIFFLRHCVLLYRLPGLLSLKFGLKFTQSHISMYLWHTIHRITLKESQLNVCDTPSTLRLGCSVKLDDGVYEESDWLQVSSCHVTKSCVESMGLIWVVLEAMEQLHTPWWYCVFTTRIVLTFDTMFCEEDNHIW